MVRYAGSRERESWYAMGQTFTVSKDQGAAPSTSTAAKVGSIAVAQPVETWLASSHQQVTNQVSAGFSDNARPRVYRLGTAP